METYSIEKKTYQGYIWMSNEDIPRVFINEPFERVLTNNEIPFIVEGRLWCPDDNKSLSIVHIDGNYYVDCFDNDCSEGKSFSIESYYPHKRLANELSAHGWPHSRLAFRRVWNSKKDPLCENFEVLEPGQLIFTGFIIEED